MLLAVGAAHLSVMKVVTTNRKYDRSTKKIFKLKED
jgi:hypothetical protein